MLSAAEAGSGVHSARYPARRAGLMNFAPAGLGLLQFELDDLAVGRARVGERVRDLSLHPVKIPSIDVFGARLSVWRLVNCRARCGIWRANGFGSASPPQS